MCSGAATTTELPLPNHTTDTPMQPSSRPHPDPPKAVVIPKDKAVFWMDARGKWCNRHGPFQHKRIIDHFNRSIRRDTDGYYLTQVRGDIIEKVYFRYADTPLFATRFIADPPLRLSLNTGETIDLSPADLYVRADQLYQCRGDERIKFTERALMDISPLLADSADGWVIRIGHSAYPIVEK
jgi:hypothetical protein